MREIKYITLKSGAQRRNLYFFECMACHKKRRSVYKNKADERICRDCRRVGINENQNTLFDPPEGHNANPEGIGMPVGPVPIQVSARFRPDPTDKKWQDAMDTESLVGKDAGEISKTIIERNAVELPTEAKKALKKFHRVRKAVAKLAKNDAKNLGSIEIPKI